MTNIEHSLRSDLTRTMLKWSGILFIFLVIFFAFSYNRLSTFMLSHEASHVLNYYTPEFSKTLLKNDVKEIQRQSKSLVAAGQAEGVVVINGNDQIVASAFNSRLLPASSINSNDDISSVKQMLQQDYEAVVFKRDIPQSDSSMWLVMNRRPMLYAIFASTAGIFLLLVLLLIIAIASLHSVLKRRLVTPVQEIKMDQNSDLPADLMALRRLRKLETSLPEETINILNLFDQLKTTHEGLRSHFAQMLDIVPSCLWWADKQGHYQQVSKRATELFGLSPQQLIGKTLWEWMSDSDQTEANIKKLNKAISQGAHFINLAYAETPSNDHTRWFGERITIKYDDKGQLSSLYGICNDISERRQQESTIQTHVEQARRMETIGTLVGGIAHEFNNMLAGIVGNIFLLRQSVDSNPNVVKLLDRVDRLIQRASSMIDQLLAFARKNQSQLRKLPLKSYLEEVLRVLPTSLKNDPKIVANLKNEVYVMADRSQVRQAIAHLLTNADWALIGALDPTITVSLNEFEGNEGFLDRHPEVATSHLIHLAVSDNGCGIEPEIIDRIFEPFFTTREIGEGPGLGLSMVYGMVRNLGGTIEVESTLGKGTTFNLYIPRAEALSIENDASGEISFGGGETLLLVDDESVMRKVAVEVLEKLGYKVIEAVNGPDALRRFEEHQHEIKLLIVDLIMPGMGGTKLAMMIRKKVPKLPVLFMSGHDLSDSLRLDISLSDSDVISKPFPVATLSIMLKRLLNSKSKANTV